MEKKIISIDVESNGLHGEAIAISAVVTEMNGKQIDVFEGCIAFGKIRNKNPWVVENVFPVINELPVYNSFDELYKAFSDFYYKHKENAIIISFVAFPVETNFFSNLVNDGYIGIWDAPFPLIDISSMMFLLGENPTSDESFAKKYDIEIEGVPHNPTTDAKLAIEIFLKCLELAKK